MGPMGPRTRNGRIQREVRRWLHGSRTEDILGSVEGAEGLAKGFMFFMHDADDILSLRLCADHGGGDFETVDIVRFGPKGVLPEDDPHSAVWWDFDSGDTVPVIFDRVIALAKGIIVGWGRERGHALSFPDGD